MILQRKKIGQAGERKSISQIASPQQEGIATTVKLKRGEQAEFDLAHNFEQKGKREQWKHLPKKKRIVPSVKDGQKVVVRERAELSSISVTVDGTTFTRAHEESKGRGQEVLIRYGSNLENMVREVRRVTFTALFDGVYQPEDDTMIACNRNLTLIQGICSENGAINISLFETTKGKPFEGYFGFGMMVRHFFRDVDFAGTVVGWASREYGEMKKAQPRSVIPLMVRMASVSATVDGISYTRSFPPTDFEAEGIVRHNLELFIRGAMAAAKTAKEQGRDSRSVKDYCYPPEGVLDMRKFETLDGKPLKDETMFRRAISQFFCDSEMVKKAIGQALAGK